MVNKIKEKIKNNKILIIVLISFLAIILGVGISYAFYAAIIKGNETSTTLQLEAGTLSMEHFSWRSCSSAVILTVQYAHSLARRQMRRI